MSWLSERVAHLRCGRLNPTVPRGMSWWVLTVNTKCWLGPVVTSTCLKKSITYSTCLSCRNGKKKKWKRHDALDVVWEVIRVNDGAVWNAKLVGRTPGCFHPLEKCHGSIMNNKNEGTSIINTHRGEMRKPIIGKTVLSGRQYWCRVKNL